MRNQAVTVASQDIPTTPIDAINFYAHVIFEAPSPRQRKRKKMKIMCGKLVFWTSEYEVHLAVHYGKMKNLTQNSIQKIDKSNSSAIEYTLREPGDREKPVRIVALNLLQIIIEHTAGDRSAPEVEIFDIFSQRFFSSPCSRQCRSDFAAKTMQEMRSSARQCVSIDWNTMCLKIAMRLWLRGRWMPLCE